MRYVAFLIVLFVAVAIFTAYEARFLGPERDPEFVALKKMCIQDPSRHGKDIGDYVERLTACHKLAKHDFYYTKAVFYRGRAHQDFKNWGASYEDVTEYLTLNPSYHQGWVIRGWLNAQKLGKQEEAIEDFTRAIERNDGPVRPFVLYRRARAAMKFVIQNPKDSYDLDMLRQAYADYHGYLEHDRDPYYGDQSRQVETAHKNITWIERQVARQGMTLSEGVQ